MHSYSFNSETLTHLFAIYSIGFTQAELTVVKGKTYRFQLTAKASGQRDIEFVVEKNGGAYTAYSNVETAMFEYTFVMENSSDNDAAISIHLDAIGKI